MAESFAHGMSMPSHRILYILNPSGNMARKFSVMRDREGGIRCDKMEPGAMDCEPFVIIDELPVEQPAINYLQFKRIVAQSVISLSEPGYPTNVYDDIQNPQRRDAVSQHLGQRFETYIYLASGAYSLGIDVWAPQKIRYADGSTASYNYSMINRRWEPNALLYKDRFGNSIPLSVTQLSEGRGGVTHRFEFPNGNATDMGSFVNALNNIGVPVTGAGNQSVTCTSTIRLTEVKVTCNRN
ncbi:hypothetical protein BurJV3_3605 [Stenotrophomonas maltophilia JV3]|nr:hypothetical protein BurJV3_3605 [Stenotrophomonas maltophilia JV3]VEF34257.1 Uncharacterised protein [Stenotrophomonas maltophilia]